jgi:TonB family protein
MKTTALHIAMILSLLLLAGKTLFSDSETGLPKLEDYVQLDVEPSVRDLMGFRAHLSFPEAAMERGEDNIKFTVAVLVDTNGTALEAKVLSSDRDSLNGELRDSLLTYSRYSPGVLNLKKTPAWMIFPFEYRYIDHGRNYGKEVNEVIVSVYIDEDGVPQTTKIIQSSGNSEIDERAEKTLMDFKDYTPAVQNGKPVGCWLVVPIQMELDK